MPKSSKSESRITLLPRWNVVPCCQILRYDAIRLEFLMPVRSPRVLLLLPYPDAAVSIQQGVGCGCPPWAFPTMLNRIVDICQQRHEIVSEVSVVKGAS